MCHDNRDWWSPLLRNKRDLTPNKISNTNIRFSITDWAEDDEHLNVLSDCSLQMFCPWNDCGPLCKKIKCSLQILVISNFSIKQNNNRQKPSLPQSVSEPRTDGLSYVKHSLWSCKQSYKYYIPIQVIYNNLHSHNPGRWPTRRTISFIICLFKSSTCFKQHCAHPQDNCINTTSGIITLC
jgi:hypothetical protein